MSPDAPPTVGSPTATHSAALRGARPDTRLHRMEDDTRRSKAFTARSLPRALPEDGGKCILAFGRETNTASCVAERDYLLRSVESEGSGRWDPLTRPAPAGENAGCGPPSPPRGRGTSISVGGLQAHGKSVESRGSHSGDPLTRPAPAGENAGCGPPSPPRGRGTFISMGGPQAHPRSE